jgi:hypothetical protein
MAKQDSALKTKQNTAILWCGHKQKFKNATQRKCLCANDLLASHRWKNYFAFDLYE